MSKVHIDNDFWAEIERKDAERRASVKTEILKKEPEPYDFIELVEAYGDCNKLGTGNQRNLDYRSTALFPLAAYREAMGDACTGYNYFDLLDVCDVLERAIKTPFLIQPAREASVCVYIHSANGEPLDVDKVILRAAKIDEIDFESPTVLRLWWD